MKQTKLTRMLSAALATLMLVAPGGIHASASQDSSTGTGSQSATLAELLSTVSYSQYLERYAGTAAGTQSVSISGDQITSFNKDRTDTDQTAVVEVEGKKGLYLPAEGIVGWDIEVPATGMYQVNIEYSAVDSDNSKTTSIERTMYINGKIPFYEARFLTLTKSWINKDESYQKDSNGNTIYKYMKDGELVYPYVNTDGKVLELKIEDSKMVFKETGESVDAAKIEGAAKYPVYQNDINGNEIKADKVIRTIASQDVLGETMGVGEIRTYIASDSTGYTLDALQFVFNEGTNTIQLEAQREEMIIYSIELVPYTPYMSYSDYVAYWEGQGAANVTDTADVKVQGEYPSATSENTIYATNDRTAYITEPQDATSILMNAIGGDGGEKWQNIGQWVRYNVTVPKSGFYQISLRFKQSVLEGTFSSRTLRVATKSMIDNGEPAKVPFYEAQYLQFNYNDDWQVETINNGVDKYVVYLEEGENILELEASLGNMAAILDTVEDAMTTVNKIYIKILMITGADPDSNRDYGFYRIMPDEVDELLNQAKVLYKVASDFEKQTGSVGSHAKTLEKVAQLLETMGSDEDEIADNLAGLKENLGTLGTWLQTSKNQPLEIDYIAVQSVGAELPKANDNLWETIKFEVVQFFMSFVADYNTLGSTEIVNDENVVQVWTTLGRDQAQIIRNLINSDFNKNNPGVSVELKLVAGGSLLPSVLAGVGPDVSMGHGAGDVINWAIRSAVTPLNDMPDIEKYVGTYSADQGFSGGYFDENGEWTGAYFTQAALIPLTMFAEYEDTSRPDEALLFGLPETQSFSMMFYRADIFNDLGLEVPTTWDDLVAILPVLQNNNMQVAMPKELGGLNLFLYQMGGDLYADNGKRINLDSDLALEAFDYMCSFFSKYRCPKDVDFATRFRTGEIPMGIMDYTTYTQLSVYATEIKGLWEFVPLPGCVTYNEDGTTSVNNTSISGTTALIMLVDEDRTEEQTHNAWKYMTWFVGAQNQSSYANELTALLGTVSKHNTANVEALESLSWSTSEYNNLMGQFNNLSAVREYPGGYIITRYVQFAFLSVYNDNADPTDSILSYIVEINKEITRKRQEFDMTYYEISYSTSFIEEGESA